MLVSESLHSVISRLLHNDAHHIDSRLGCGTGGQASQAIGQHRVGHEANQTLQIS